MIPNVKCTCIFIIITITLFLYISDNPIPIINNQCEYIDEKVTQVPSLKFIGYLGFVFRTTVYIPFGGGSYIPTPKELSNSMQGIINIRNEGNESCFWYSLIYGLLPTGTIAKDPQRVSQYKKFMNVLKIPKDMSFERPPSFHEYSKVANANKINLNILYCETGKPKQIDPFYNSKHVEGYKDVTLLLMEDELNNKHFVVVKSMSKLLGSIISKDSHKMHFCNCCHSHYPSEAALATHKSFGCDQHPSARIKLPIKGIQTRVDKDGNETKFRNDILKFKNIQNQIVKPFVMYGDLEAFTTVMPGAEVPRGTEKYQHHQAADLSYCVIDRSKPEQKTELFECSNAVEYLESIIDQARKYRALMKESCDLESDIYHPIEMTPQDTINHECATNCYLCKKALNGDSVRDHDHLTGKYRGAAHSECNTLCRNDRYKMDFFFHNGKNYDFHYIINAISELCKKINMCVDCIPLNTEKYLSITLKGADFNITFKLGSNELHGPVNICWL